MMAIIEPNWGHAHNRNLVAWWISLPSSARGGVFQEYAATIPAHGAMTGAPTWGAVHRPGMLAAPPRFTAASSQYALVTNTTTLATLFSTTVDSTVAVWVWIPSSPSAWSGIVTKGRDLAAWWGLWISDTNKWYMATLNDIFSTATAGAGWTHLVGTKSGNSAKLYVNGVSDGADASDTTDRSNTSELWIGGAKSVSEYLTGAVDDVRLWNRALSADEIWALYQDSRQNCQATLVRKSRWQRAAAAVAG